MKILFITPSPPNKLNRVRAFYLIKGLHRSGASVTLVSLYSKEEELRDIEELKPCLKEVFLIKNNRFISLLKAFISIFTPYSMEMGFCINVRLLSLLFSLRNDYDYVYLKRLRMAPYAFIFPNEKVLLDETDSMSLSYKNMLYEEKGIKKILYLEEYLKYSLAERYYLKKYQFILCSQKDIAYLNSRYSRCIKPILLENGLDLDLWSDSKVYSRNHKVGKKLFFWGILDYVPNRKSLIDFTTSIFPKTLSGYDFYIIGPGKRFDVPLSVRDKIHFLGYVDDITKELKKYDIFVCPLIIGTGIKNKIIQAAALGIPIVATEVALDGVDEKMRRYFFIAKDGNYLQKIEQIQGMPTKEISRKMASQAKYAQSRYNSTDIVKSFYKRHLKKSSEL